MFMVKVSSIMIHDTNSKYCLRARKPVGKPIRGGGLVTSPGFYRSPILDRVTWWRGSIMISPQNVKTRAKSKEDENYAFRRYLKMHADPIRLVKK